MADESGPNPPNAQEVPDDCKLVRRQRAKHERQQLAEQLSRKEHELAQVTSTALQALRETNMSTQMVAICDS